MPELVSVTSLPVPETELEFGVSINMPFSSYTSTQELMDSEPISIEQLREMRRRDAQVRSLYRLMTLPIRASLRNFTVIPFEDGDKEAEFLEQQLKLPPHAGGMTVTLERVINQALLALCDRFSPFEVVYRVPETGPLAGKLCIRKIAWRPPETCKFRVDESGGFAGIRQSTSYLGREVDAVFEPPYVWYFAAQEEECPFYGQSYFLPAWYHFDEKMKLYFVTHVAAQTRAVPARIGSFPEGAPAKAKDAFRRGLADIGMAQAMLKPEKYTVEEFGRSVANFDYVGLLSHHNQMQSKSVLAEFVDRLDKTAMVDFSTSEDDMFILALQSVMSEIETSLNQHVFANLIDWNFGTGKYPEFRFSTVSEQQKRAIADVFKTLAAAAAPNVTPEFMYELEKQMALGIGLPVDYDELDVKKDEELLRQRELESSQAAATKAQADATASNPDRGLKVAASSPSRWDDYLSLSDLHQLTLRSADGDS